MKHFVDAYDLSKSNWMRFVNPASSSTKQNLVACQIDSNIYFYSIKEIPANSELLVWYSPQFASRMEYPLTVDSVTQKPPYSTLKFIV